MSSAELVFLALAVLTIADILLYAVIAKRRWSDEA
jgi:hypothetical protein